MTARPSGNQPLTPVDLARLVEIVVDEVLAAARETPSPARCTCHAVQFECCPDQVGGLIGAGAARLGLQATGGSTRDVAAIIDHTLLKPDATQRDVEQVCREALEFGFATVC